MKKNIIDQCKYPLLGNNATVSKKNEVFAPENVDILAVHLSNTLDLVLLLDGIAIGGSSSGVDDLVSKALSDGLDITEGRLTSTSGHQVDGLVHATEGRDIHGLPTYNTGGTHAGRILARSGVCHSVH